MMGQQQLQTAMLQVLQGTVFDGLEALHKQMEVVAKRHRRCEQPQRTMRLVLC